jgi:hypothetical protein
MAFANLVTWRFWAFWRLDLTTAFLVILNLVFGGADANWQFALPLQFSNKSIVRRSSRRRIRQRSGIRRGRRKLTVCATYGILEQVNRESRFPVDAFDRDRVLGAGDAN